ncbi:structural maintenance of chromosomes protein [Chloropicon primus]|uniref:Structural maintenance of chromosomes protein n=1 Tax=Chloropicon primus TaxID=1764295 RepID=A0A5B8MNZ7_9CHLO|nr:structural maintenance of chromosomes protein [Chloropicon primus]|eukprot:QDZ22253.1 structural maintenance of chromosomes protein [Chloropicon primus]
MVGVRSSRRGRSGGSAEGQAEAGAGSVSPSRVRTSGEGYRLEWIELTDFKSYAGTHKLGPFDEGVNAVIGPNGSGKSNVMDAIAFVLGSKSKDLRCASSFKDLVHTPKAGEQDGEDEDGEGSGPREAVVSAHLSTLDGEGGQGRRLEIQRSCNTRGTCEYRVNGRRVAWEAYKGELQRAGILCNSSIKSYNLGTSVSSEGGADQDGGESGADEVAPLCGSSFLFVFQGEVDGLAARTSKELCTLFEHSSGSILMKEAYDGLLAQKREADEKTSLAYSKKRGVAAEKRDMKAQKEEADRFVQKTKRLEEVKAELALAKLYFQAQQINDKVEEKGELEETVASLTEECSGLEKELNEARAQSGKVQRSSTKVAKALSKAKKQASQNGSAVSLKHVEGEINQTIKKLRSNEAKVKKLTEQNKQHVEEIESLEEQAALKEKDLADLEASASGKSKEGKVKAADEDEYNSLKAEAGKQSAILQQDKDALERRKEAEKDTLVALESEARELNQTLQQLEAENEEVNRNLSSKDESLKEVEGKLKHQQKEQKQLSQGHKKNSARRDQLQSKLGELEGEMREAKSYKKQRERDARMFTAITNLKQTITGVYGRLSELCKISESKYTLAITVALGKNMDAVVVEDVSTAKECIQWLKNHFLPPMMFLPLRTIKARPINEMSRNLGGTSKLAYDIVQFSPQFERVVRFVCGSTVVCESHVEAKSLAYGRERHKVVTEDGTLFDKAGTITGGKSQGMERLVQRWNEAHVQNIKKSYESLSAEYRQLPSLNQMIADEQENQKAIEGFQQQLSYLKAESKAQKDKSRHLVKEVAAVQEKKSKHVPLLKACRDKVDKHNKDSEKIDAQLNEITDTVFKDFSRKVGVKNIREYEKLQLKEQHETREKRLLFNTELSKIRSQLQYERKRDTAKPLEKMEKQISQDTTKLEKLKKKEKELIGKSKVEKESIINLENELAELQKQHSDADEKTKAAKSKFTEVSKNLKEASRKIETKENSIEQHRTECEDILQSAVIDHVKLPTSTKKVSNPLEGLVIGGKSYVFDSLDASVKSLANAKDKQNFEEIKKEEIQNMQVELERENPNLKAAEQYEKTVEQEKELGEELESARKECDAISKEFTVIKNKRCKAFMKTFEAVTSSIDSIYKELTGGSGRGGDIGGTAYLSLENPDEPYLAGIKYTAMPPTKRFRDMTDLSGGEKTVAALALLFAINLSSPGDAEFFVLDEIDAALDSTNVSRVARFLRGRSKQFQTIVISLKDTFYDKADCLHGVTRNPESGFSNSFTLDLKAFAA